MLKLATGAGALVLAATAGAAAAPRVIAIVPARGGPVVEALDARTLVHPRGGWTYHLEPAKRAAISGTKVAVATGPNAEHVVVLDAATGRILYSDSPDASVGLFGIGGGEFVAVGFNCSSGGCGDELTVVGSGGSTDINDVGNPIGALPEGLVLTYGPREIEVYGDNDLPIELPRMTAPFAVVVDVAHDRLFEVSSAGLVAEVDHVRRGPAVHYHRVALNGRPFSAAWSGGGRIALWGQDGLGTIDTRTWTTHSLAPAIVGAVGTPFGLAAWSEQGITVYRPAGTVRLHALAGLAVQSAQSVGDYLYAQSGARRYAINLRTGVTYGPLSARATIVTPGFVSIP